MYSSITSEKAQVTMMLRYEIKKIFSTFSSKISVFILSCIVVLSSWLAITGVEWINEQGDPETGLAAIAKLKEAQNQWEGELDEEMLRAVIQELQRINATPEAQSKDYNQNDIAYGWEQGFMPIRDTMNYTYAANFNSYDYYTAERVSAAAAGDFYTNRTKLLKDYLYNGDGKNAFSEAEKEYLIRKYEEIKTPFYYDYAEGWSQLLYNSPTVIMIGALILGYLVAGIFSNEFKWKSDSISFTSVHGRKKATASKIKAGFFVITTLYWAAIIIYTLVTLCVLGFEGANCPLQLGLLWKCPYNLTLWETYLLATVGGYIGNLFFAFLTMWVSAKTRSGIFAVTVPFILIFLPTFLDNLGIESLSNLVGLFPDQLLKVYQVIRYFRVYEVFGTVFSAMSVVPVLYAILSAALVPVMYREFRTK